MNYWHLPCTLSLQLHCVSVVVSHSPATQTVMCIKDSGVKGIHNHKAHKTLDSFQSKMNEHIKKDECVSYNTYIFSQLLPLNLVLVSPVVKERFVLALR